MNEQKSCKSIVVAILAFCFGIWGAWILIDKGTIGELSFISLIVLTVFVSCLIAFSEKIDHLKLIQFEIKFNKIKKTETAIKELASCIIEVTEATTDSSIMDETFDEQRYKNALNNLKKLLH